MKSSEIHLSRCTVMVRGGAIAEVGERVAVVVAAEGSVFAAIDDAGENAGVLLRQIGEKASTTEFRETLGNGASNDGIKANEYYHVLPLMANGNIEAWPTERTSPSAGLHVGNGILKKLPWLTVEPRKLAEPGTAREVFALKTKSAELWDLSAYAGLGSPAPKRLLGTRYLMGSELYVLPLARFVDPSALTKRIVQPDLSEDDARAAGIYRFIRNAVEEANPGDEILLRWSGPITVRPVELDRPDVKLTIKPDEHYKPVLVLSSRTNRYQSMFRMAAGQLVLENLQFRIGSEKTQLDSTRCIVSMPAGGSVSFKGCVITMLDQDGLSAVQLGDPREEMMMADPMEKPTTPPKIAFENTLVRGRGKLLAVRSSRSFELDVKETLAALDGSLIDIRATSQDTSSAMESQIRLSRVTTYLTGPVFDLETSSRKAEMKGVGLVPTQALAVQSLFVPVNHPPAPLIKMERVDSDALMKDLFNYRGSHDNFYAYDGAGSNLLERTPDSAEAATPMPIDTDRWLELYREPGKPFGPLRFIGPLPEVGKSLIAVKPQDFRRRGDEGGDAGATLEILPIPFEEEK